MAESAEQTISAPSSSRRNSFLICSLLALLTLALYWQLRGHGFINYDDPYYVTGNSDINKGFTKEGVVWAFCRLTGHGTYWHPVTWLSHMLDCQLFGMNAGAHHLMNAAFHALNAALLFLLLRQLTGAFWRSALVAALFAFHPLQVESVAWAAERKNVLSTFFALLSLLFYAAYAQRQRRKEAMENLPASHSPFLLFYFLALLFFALGLMSKPMIVTLPFVFLLLDFWPLKRIKGDATHQFSLITRRLVEKIPFFVLSAASAYITIAAHKRLDLVVSSEEFSWLQRSGNAVVAYALYIWKAIWPEGLAIYYPLPATRSPTQILCGVLVIAAISFFAIRAARQRPWLTVGWLWFLGTFVPVIGIVQVNDQAMADRFAYVPLIGLFIVIVWSAGDLAKKIRLGTKAMAASAVLALIACAVTTFAQTKHWKTSETIFSHAVQVTKGNYVAHNNLGRELVSLGRMDEAVPHFEEVIKLRYYTALAHNNIGISKAQRGDIDGALQSFREALKSDPKDADVHANIGLALIYKKQNDEALQHLTEAVRLNPNHVDARNHMATACESLGRLSEAVGHYRESLRLKSLQPKVHFVLGGLLAREGKNDDARLHFTEAVRQQPGFAEAEQQLRRLSSLDLK